MDMGEGSRAGGRQKRQIGWGAESDRSAGFQTKGCKGQGGEAVMDFDVFLNHRGPDVKGTFVAHLYEELEAMGLNPFLDKYSLAPGSEAFASIDAALEEAKVHVAVVSVGYADSKYCLSELVAMLRSRKPVIPVFYDMEPSQLRRVDAGAFAKAFQKHEERETADQVREWKEALCKLADITGIVFRLSDYHGDEAKLKQKVVVAVLGLLAVPRAVQVESPLVGLEGHRKICASKVKAMSGTTSVLGLVGMRGVGKSCLARVLYNHLIKHGEFKAACFLDIGQSLHSSVEDGGSRCLEKFQAQLLRDLLRLGEQRQAQQPYQYWYSRLSRLGPVLIVFDDIQAEHEFDKLIPIPAALPQGSCIIATSCNQHLLKLISRTVKFQLHTVTPLNSEDSEKLFNLHTFDDEEAPENFKALSKDVSNACDGLPLALKLVGRGLYGKTSPEHQKGIWPETIEAVIHGEAIEKTLMWSYDRLPQTEKLMFLDIASSFCGFTKEYALQVFRSCKCCLSCCGNKSPSTCLENLIDKSLVTLDLGVIRMHGLLQDLGQLIGENERSHMRKDMARMAVECDMQVQSLNRVRALNLGYTGGGYQLDLKNFGKMPDLHFLVVDGCVLHGNLENISEQVRYLRLINSQFMQSRHVPPKPLLCMPNLPNLVSLDMSGSSELATAWIASPMEAYPNMVNLDLSNCKSITRLPDSVLCLSKLEVLKLNDCTGLQKLPDSIDRLSHLRELLLSGCENLQALPSFSREWYTHPGSSRKWDRLLGDLLVGLRRLRSPNTRAFNFFYRSQARPQKISNLENVISVDKLLSSETVVLSGCVDKNIRRECAVVVSTKSYGTRHMLFRMTKTFQIPDATLTTPTIVS